MMSNLINQFSGNNPGKLTIGENFQLCRFKLTKENSEIMRDRRIQRDPVIPLFFYFQKLIILTFKVIKQIYLQHNMLHIKIRISSFCISEAGPDELFVHIVCYICFLCSAIFLVTLATAAASLL